MFYRNRIADCRKCLHFTPVEKLSEDLVLEAEWYKQHGVKILGWCKRFGRFVKYYRGKCWGFEPVEEARQRSLFEFL